MDHVAGESRGGAGGTGVDLVLRVGGCSDHGGGGTGRCDDGGCRVQECAGHAGAAKGRIGVADGNIARAYTTAGNPLWMAFAGGAISIGLGKAIFGGIGGNVFNPALVGRAFLQAAFPVALTTWPAVSQANRFTSIPGALLAPPMMKAPVDAVSSATPLASFYFDGITAGIDALLLGSTTGSLGEAAGLVILLSGLYLAARRILNWRIPVSILATVVILASVMHAIDPVVFPDAGFHVFAGGLLFGAVFMATDPVTSPLTQKGCWVFGFGIGVLVVVIRQFGGLPEGVMYAILFMNAATPLIDRLTQARTYGSEKPERFTR